MKDFFLNAANTQVHKHKDQVTKRSQEAPMKQILEEVKNRKR